MSERTGQSITGIKETVSPDNKGPVLACFEKAGPGGEPLTIFKIFRTSSNFLLIFNILKRLMGKALQELLLIWAILEKYSQCENYLQKALQYTLNSDQYYSALN